MVAEIAEADTDKARPHELGVGPTRGSTAAAVAAGRRRPLTHSLIAATVTALMLLLAGAGSASASPEIHDRGPSGTADITLRPTSQLNQLMLVYHFVNTDGAFAGRVEFSPVGFGVATPKPNRFVGSQVRGVVLFPYTPGTPVSVGVHVLFVTADGSDETNSLNPYVVTYPQ